MVPLAEQFLNKIFTFKKSPLLKVEVLSSSMKLFKTNFK